MHSWPLAGMVALSCLLPCASAAADDATMFRIFLGDGFSLVSYGEIARVSDRVVFSMPTASTPNPPLQLVNIAADRVDWERTNRYAAAARAAHYVATQAANDYAALSNRIAQTLNDVALTSDSATRLAIVEQARKGLAEWPRNHFNYRQGEVRQMLSMLDEAIADLRVAAGQGRFDLNFVAYASPPALAERLLPPPSPREAIEQIMTAARLSESAAERASLRGAILLELDREAAVLPAAWVTTTREEMKATIRAELLIDRTYQSLTARMMAVAEQRARLADVRGLERIIVQIHQRDEALGGTRPEAVEALVIAVQQKLDAARRVRLAEDRWALRAPAIRTYRLAISTPMDQFARLRPSLEDIKALAGSSSVSLAAVQHAVAQIAKAVAAIAPPEEFLMAHALLVSAAQLADSAARIRREAALSGDIARAWDASSAAAGALMLGARARSDIQTLAYPPRFR